MPNLVRSTLVAAMLVLSIYSSCGFTGSTPRPADKLLKKQVPAEPTGVRTIHSPRGITIRYKEPETEGVCETTPGVNSYSGYVDLDENTHMFFWFFEARHNPDEAPLTLWLNGGPGSDSLIGLFEELGPCNVTRNRTSLVNPYAWNEVSNLLFLSQPIGVGFSYAESVVGVINDTTQLPIPDPQPDGRYSDVDPYRFDTTNLAAVGTWEILQGFIENLPCLDPTVKSRSFNLWTESYGGHYGPAFFRYFYDQNSLIRNGSIAGIELNMHSLGIINGIVSERIQAPYYPELAYRNTYGIEAVNETIYNYMKLNYYFPGGCRDSIDLCYEQDRSTPDGKAICSQATAICRSLVEGPYYVVSGRNPYDIRAKSNASIPPSYWVEYLNTARVQNAIGVDINYTSTSSSQVGIGFDYTGDFVYPNLLDDLETILDYGVRIAMIYGDADYICNWMGGEAVSLAVNYTGKAEFASAGYAPFIVDGTEYGESRQYGNFSFTRVYDAGHEVPYYQPKAALELFRRVLAGLAVSDGGENVTRTYKSGGTVNATHTNSYVTYYTGRPGESKP
ncbi:Alpha/Beta hydrolase protein [Durotheca rogersii]|uniref:Alpha/Beta hydrolase protein n=1 Tax=Durotheca rogersii TaxID=419775 RepID=UPI002220B8FA|nr:Alpha/Beta hydrolase protein [Durotheca rogersii]KAI5856180.1 Alpha/Beta hydrolase protein [Durotheca rogersii]